MIFFENIYTLAYNLSFYILIGSVAAGFLHIFISDSYIKKHLGKSSIGSVLKAAIFGVPLPFCSCSVVPFAVSLKKSGASEGSVLSFLISTPITGADSIAATYGVFGWLFTIYRVFTSLIIAIIAGILTNLFSVPVSIAAEDNPENIAEKKRKGSIKEALDYGFNTVFKDIAKPLAFGIVLGGIITSFMPHDFGQLASEYYILSYIAMIVIAPPLYICATSSIPIAASLILVGFPAGAAFVLLSAGPATSTVTMSIVYKNLGKKVFGIYLSTIIISSILFGMLLDAALEYKSINIIDMVIIDEESSALFAATSILFALLLLYYIFLEPLKNKYLNFRT